MHVLTCRWLVLCVVALVGACGDEGGATGAPDAGQDAAAPTECMVDNDCDDGAYCNGAETCDATDPNADPVTHCVSGVAVACSDAIECTRDVCDEASDSCEHSAPDVDGDGHADAACVDADGEPMGDDCDDGDADRFPANTEVCDLTPATTIHDEDCDALTFGTRDMDQDTHVDDRCCNTDDDGVSRCGDDCNDDESSAFVGATEICDAIDNDCDPARAIDNGLFCGACQCAVPNATPSCTAGPTQCTVGVCDTGYLNCDMDSVNGCESERDQDTSCGQCGNVCTTHASCAGTGSGTFACECDAGFSGDGVTCSNVDECTTDNGGCDVLTTCTDNEGGRTCGACPSGYTGDGASGCAPALMALTFSFVGLDPIVHPTQDVLSVNVPMTIASMSLTPSVAAGVSVAIDGTAAVPSSPWFTPTLMLGANVIEIEVAQAGRPSRTYTLTITRGSRIDYLKASNTGFQDYFGSSVAIDGDTLVIGAPWESSAATTINGDQTDDSADGAGAAYVFVRTSNGWAQQAYLKPVNAEALDFFGGVVAISGDTIAVAADEESSATASDPLDNSAFFAGSVFVYVRNGSTWTQQAYLKAADPDAYDFFGGAIALDGDTLVATARGDDSASVGVGGDPTNNGRQDSGAAFVFVRTGGTWTQQAFLKAHNADADDYFGSSVALHGDTLVVGAPYESSEATTINGDGTNNGSGNSGAAYVFVRSGTSWAQQAYLKASNAEPDDYFGGRVAISVDTVVVGAEGEDSDNPGINPAHNNDSTDVGAAYVFARSGTSWAQQAYLKASNASEGDLFGNEVAIEGDVIAVGALAEDSDGDGLDANPDDDSAPEAGAAYLFTRAHGAWSETAYLKAPASGAGDNFGALLAISNGVLVVGAPEEDSDATGYNGSQTNNDEPDSGAAYVYR